MSTVGPAYCHKGGGGGGGGGGYIRLQTQFIQLAKYLHCTQRVNYTQLHSLFS